MNNTYNKNRINLLITISLFFISIISGSFIYRCYNQKKLPFIKNNVEISDKVATLENNHKINKDVPTSIEDKDTINVKLNDKGIPILMYHSIGSAKGNLSIISKDNFKLQMKYLKDNGYSTLTLNDAYNFFINNKPVPEKSVVLTFDDGYKDNYEDVFPILKELNFKATIFVITNTVDKDPNYMTSSQLKEMHLSGFDIESHTTNHENLKDSSYENQIRTLQDSKTFLEKILDKKIEYLAYPYGKYSNKTLDAAAQVGYKMAFSTDGRWSDKHDGIFTLDRVFISGAATLDVFIDRITNPNYKF